MACRFARALVVEQADIADTTAEDHHIGVQYIDDAGDRAAEIGRQTVHGCVGVEVLANARGDFGQWASYVGALGVIMLEEGTREDGFDASPASAIALRSFCIKQVVTPFAGDALAAIEGFLACLLYTSPSPRDRG